MQICYESLRAMAMKSNGDFSIAFVDFLRFFNSFYVIYNGLFLLRALFASAIMTFARYYSWFLRYLLLAR